MATRRRVGVSNATTEAARRQLMQPVTCWEKVWFTPENAPSLKVFKWVKTDKVPHFEDEIEVDAPLAPLPDEPEVVELVEEEMEQEETQPIADEKPAMNAEPPETTQEPEESKPPSPKPQLTMTTELTIEDMADAGDALDASLKPMDPSGIGETSLMQDLSQIVVDGDSEMGNIGALDASLDASLDHFSVDSLVPDLVSDTIDEQS
ncbi:hypothetical protein BDP27DRAFT_1313844 [Rhodocollybia butyracea]|uniref:Uncharacterized protein n=1 Tax=Rhodocollybia butyracea TaxID=206335 RepID=A0A9P5Q8A2_9AGAR|nr:hypothetical protein BDP27DRAFT_1313844 [Rhodocollybia butyracea]